MNLGNSGGGGGGGSVSTASSSCVLKGSDVVSDQFPAGLRVLVVDDDPTCLVILEKMLRNCRYEVTTCNRAEIALSRLRKNKDGFDIVISDVHMPDMDGFKLLEHIGLEMDLPVIMMSADDGKNVVMKGVTHGACDYLIKPVRIEALKNIWQHVVRKKKNEWKDLDQSGSMDDGDGLQKPLEDADYSSSANEGTWRSSKKRKDDEDEVEDRDDTSALKKPRVVWSVELHQQFVAAVNQLGIDKAVPKRILELMNVPGLTRENVASHLQKYRLYLRRLSGVSQHQGGLNNSFMGIQDASFGAMSSLNGVDLQALAVAGQIPPQSLACFQAAGLGRSTPKSVLPMSMVDQRNLFSFENPKMRYGDVQSQQQHQQQQQHHQQQQQSSSNKQMNLLHGIPTTMEPKQLANLHQSAQAFGAMNMQVQPHGNQVNPLLMHMALPQPRGQPILSTGIIGGVSARSGVVENGRGSGYISVSQSSSIGDFPINQTTELPGISFPLGSTPVSGLSSVTSKGMFQEHGNSHIKGSRGFLPSYDIFDELQQHKSPNWDSQRAGLAFDTSQHTNSIQSHMHVSPSVLVHQGVSSGQKSLQNSYPSKVTGNGKVILLAGEGSEQRNTRNMGQSNNNTQLGDNSSRVKTETITQRNIDTTLFSQQYGQPQDDLLSALFKQQEAMGQPGSDFDFDGYSMDDITRAPVHY